MIWRSISRVAKRAPPEYSWQNSKPFFYIVLRFPRKGRFDDLNVKLAYIKYLFEIFQLLKILGP